MKKYFRPGEKAPDSGQYEIIGSRGGKTGKEITSNKGKILPPTDQVGQTYRLVDATKHC